MDDLNSLLPEIRDEITGIFAQQDQRLNSNQIQAWLSVSTTIIDLDPDTRRAIIQIYSPTELPFANAPQGITDLSSAKALHGLRGIQLDADMRVWMILRDIHCASTAPGEYPENILRISSAVMDAFQNGPNPQYAANPTQLGLSLLVQRLEKAKADAAAGPCGEEMGIPIGSNMCLTAGRDFSVLRCVEAREEATPGADQHDPAKEAAVVAYSHMLLQPVDCPFHINGEVHLIFALPSGASGGGNTFEDSNCSIGDPGCDTAYIQQYIRALR